MNDEIKVEKTADDTSGRYSYGDGKEYARVVLDSIGPNGRRLITVEAHYWRMIHSELLTHRAFSRNSASSRAIPFFRTKDGLPITNCTYSMVKHRPFIPEFLGSEQKGMQSGGELSGPARREALYLINEMRLFCLDKCRRLSDLGLHKSIINRYVEPWLYTTVLITATEWKNFIRLRVHPKAEKHFCKIAKLIKCAIGNSTPKRLEAGQWHMPYIREDDDTSNDLRRVSSARCARLSYLTHDGRRDVSEDLRLFEDLINPKIEADQDEDVIHASPLEHVAQAMEGHNYRSGPFVGWHQFRKEFPNENAEGI